jgi:hypothetical protein
MGNTHNKEGKNVVPCSRDGPFKVLVLGEGSIGKTRLDLILSDIIADLDSNTV